MRSNKISTAILIIVLFGTFTLAKTATAAIRYVDKQISSANCLNYDLSTRSCGAGSATAYKTFTGATSAANQGDTVFIRGGTYSEQLIPVNSGSGGNYITYTNYNAESVIITGISSIAIILDNVSYIIVDGLTINDIRWLEATDSNYNIIRNNTFTGSPASGTTGNVRFITSHYNKVLNNTISDGNDNLLFIDSNNNLAQGNTITEGRHSLLGIRCSNYNVIRDNYFTNTQQKIAEIYDCGTGTNAVPNCNNCTKHNLIENNEFADSYPYYSTSAGNGIQYAGQNGIVRRNVFYKNNVGIAMQVYSDEALYNRYNRVYHNVFYGNDCAGVAVRSGGLDNIFTNNILNKNLGASGNCNGDGGAQIVYRNPIEGFKFVRNLIRNVTAGENVVQVEFATSGNTLSYYETNYPNMFSDNLDVDPGFFNEINFDFHLTAESALHDAGVFLTQTTSAGSGTIIPLEDASNFYDGYGIAGEQGDQIQFEGQTNTATVLNVNYANNTITVDIPLTWTNGQGISLKYTGTAPNVGAFENDTEPLIRPSPPANLQILN